MTEVVDKKLEQSLTSFLGVFLLVFSVRLVMEEFRSLTLGSRDGSRFVIVLLGLNLEMVAFLGAEEASF